MCVFFLGELESSDALFSFNESFSLLPEDIFLILDGGSFYFLGGGESRSPCDYYFLVGRSPDKKMELAILIGDVVEMNPSLDLDDFSFSSGLVPNSIDSNIIYRFWFIQ